MSPAKKLLFTAIMAVLALVLLEIVAYGVLAFETWRRPYKFRHEAAYYLERVPAGWLEGFYERAYHPVFGWDGARYDDKPGTKGAGKAPVRGYDDEGARKNPAYAERPPLIAAYGDSFTKGAEVEWNESWPYYLSEMLDAYVANYAVGGYGPDQATLKFRASPIKEPKPAFAVLGIFEENINRVVNRFRPYYEEEGRSFLAFKPRFAVGPEGPHLLPSPLAEPVTDRQALAGLVEEARAGDVFWDRKVDLAFPYSFALGKLAVLALGKLTGKALPLGILSGDLWGAETAAATMNAVIDAFVAEAEARQVTPVILFLPRIRRETLEDRDGWEPEYADFLRALRARSEQKGLIVLDAAEADFEPAAMNVEPFAGHYSPYGNKVVAGFLRDKLGLAGPAASAAQ